MPSERLKRQIKRVKLSSKVFSLQHKRLGTGNIERHVSRSFYLQNTRGVDVYLPPGYNPLHRRYPVLYMHDGNNLFFKAIAFGGMPWRINHVLDRLITLQYLPPLIVVGVYNTQGRDSEYTWNPMGSRWGVEGGDGERYAQYLVEELKPFIDNTYITLTGPEYTGVMGSSLGGLISFYLGYYYPHIFGKIGMISPSLWWNRKEVFQRAYHYPQREQLWLDMGTREGGRGLRVDQNPGILNARHLVRVMQQRGYRLGEDLGYLEDRGGMHNEWSWGQRVHLALIFLFGTAAARRLILK